MRSYKNNVSVYNINGLWMSKEYIAMQFVHHNSIAPSVVLYHYDVWTLQRSVSIAVTKYDFVQCKFYVCDVRKYFKL